MDEMIENHEYQLQFLDFDKNLRQEWENNRQPYAVIVELTSKCNMNCVHCYLHNHHDSKELPYENIIEILDILHENGVLFITFTGGEIFTRRDFIDIYMYAKRKGFIIDLFSNGYLINDQIISVLSQYPPLLVDISLYGACEETYYKVTGVRGAFERVITNCKKLAAAGIRVALKSPILTLTLDEVDSMKMLAEELGIQLRCSFEIMSDIDGNSVTRNYHVSMAEAIKYEAKDLFSGNIAPYKELDYSNIKADRMPLFQCNVGRGSFIIDYEGNMFPCMKMRHHGKKVKKDNFTEIWESYACISEEMSSVNFKCITCKNRRFCDVCPAEMEFVYGNKEYRPEYMCKYAQARRILHTTMSLDEALILYNE